MTEKFKSIKDYMDAIAFIAESTTPPLCEDEEPYMCYYSRVDKSYITHVDLIENDGLIKFLFEKGVTELQTNNGKVACIGWCGDEQKWYGWSHRAIYGFGIGSEVKRGDCGYVPVDEADASGEALRFWKDDNRTKLSASEVKTDEHGLNYVDIQWEYDSETPNEQLRGAISGTRHYLPKEFGKGEWKAETLEDAKQMAKDFAEGVG